jgi:hypothetical protein
MEAEHDDHRISPMSGHSHTCREVPLRGAPARMPIMFRPWGSVVLIVGALALITTALVDVKRRRQRREQGWTTGHKLGVVSMCLLVLSQALLLI